MAARRPNKSDVARLTADQQRASAAKQLLDNPMLKEAFNAVDERFIRMFVNSPLRDAEGRELIHKLLVASKEYKHQLIVHINTGKLADVDLKQILGDQDGA